MAGILGFLWRRAIKVIIIVLVLGICGSLTINHNLAFQKVERSDVVVPIMVEAYEEMPVIIAIQHYTHGQTGEIMSLAWQFQELVKNQKIAWQPNFFLAPQEKKDTASLKLRDNLDSINPPFQLWLVNFSPSPNLADLNCIPNEKYQRRATGYKYRLHTCSL